MENFEPNDRRLVPTGDPEAEWVLLWCPPDVVPAGRAPDYVLKKFNEPVLAAWPRGDAPPPGLGEYLVDRAYASVRPPASLGASWPRGDESNPMITQLDAWMWLSPSQRLPISATVALFGYSATVTLTPVEASFTAIHDDRGDRYEESVTCGLDDMVRFDHDVRFEDQHTDCMVHFRYRRGDSRLVTEVRYVPSVVCDFSCGARDLDDVVATRVRPIVVNEWIVRNN